MDRMLVRCEDCQTEFELFADLSKTTTCIGGRQHRSVRLSRER